MLRKSYIVLLLDTTSPYSVPLCISTTINTNCRIGLYMKELRTVLNVAVGGTVAGDIITMTTTGTITIIIITITTTITTITTTITMDKVWTATRDIAEVIPLMEEHLQELEKFHL